MSSHELDALTHEILQRVSTPVEDSVKGDNARADIILVIEKRGRRLCFGYSHLTWTCLHPSGVLTLHFDSHTIQLEGTRLALLQERLMRKQVLILEAKDKRYSGWRGAADEVEIDSVIVRDAKDDPNGPWVDGYEVIDKSGSSQSPPPAKPA